MRTEKTTVINTTIVKRETTYDNGTKCAIYTITFVKPDGLSITISYDDYTTSTVSGGALNKTIEEVSRNIKNFLG